MIPYLVVGVSSSGSSVGNYSGLIASVVDHMKDDSLEDRVPDFIYYAEALFNRQLYPLNDETSATLELAEGEGAVDLPTDFKKARSLYLTADPKRVLKQLDPDNFKDRFLNANAGPPENYCILGGELLIGPDADADYDLTLKYVRGLQNLSQSNQTNWLIEAHPDLYFHGALMYAELDGWNDERGRNFAETTMEILSQVKFWDAQRRRGDNHDTVAGSYY